MRLADLTAPQHRTIEDLALKYLDLYEMALARGRTARSAALAAGEPKRTAYGKLLDWGCTPDEAVEAFREMCGLVDGVTA